MKKIIILFLWFIFIIGTISIGTTSEDLGIDGRSFIIDLTLSIFLYMIVPIIISIKKKEGLLKREVKKIIIINSILVYVLFVIIAIMLDLEKIPSPAPAFFYGIINYYMLLRRTKKVNKEEINNSKQDEELYQFIDKPKENNENKNDIKYCTNCGKQINTTDKFCGNCGHEIYGENKTKLKEPSLKYYKFFYKIYLVFIIIRNLISFAYYFDINNNVMIIIQSFLIVLYVCIPLALINGMSKKTKFSFKLLMIYLIIDYIYMVVISSNSAYLNDPSISFLIYYAFAVIIVGIWFVPNMVYFLKRRNIFIN